MIITFKIFELVFVIYIFYLITVIMNIMYIFLNKVNRKDIILNQIYNMKYIKIVKCDDRHEAVYNCVKITNILPKDSYILLNIYKNVIVHYGKSTIINLMRNKTINNPYLFIKTESFSVLYFRNIILNEYGAILTSCNRYLSIKGGCRCSKETQKLIFNITKISKYKLVFSITQFLGSAIYHSVINCLTKIIPLLNSINILSYSKIHIHFNHAIIYYFHLLGISKSRLVKGNIYGENVVLMKRVECTSSIYTSSVIELRSLLLNKTRLYSNLYHNNYILFIKRIYTRKIKNFEDVIFSICKAFTNFSCAIYKPDTNFRTMVKMFMYADIIFGPHGAGFTNIILSKKDVAIAELLKYIHPVLCYAKLSSILGYKYYGIYTPFNAISEEFNINSTFLIKIFRKLLHAQ